MRVLLIGHLRGTATVSGLRFLDERILPQLSVDLPWTFRIVGGFTLPPDLRLLVAHPLVRMCGQVSPADEEFRLADVVLVPTPIPLGMRVRILTAMSFGCCIVAHEANALGIPELADGVNCRLFKTGEEAAMALTDFAEFTDVRRAYGAGARKTYEECFSLETAGREFVRRVEDAWKTSRV